MSLFFLVCLTKYATFPFLEKNSLTLIYKIYFLSPLNTQKWVPHLYISFIIESECNELVESVLHYLLKMGKNKVDNVSQTDRNGKSGQHLREGGSNKIALGVTNFAWI